MFKEAGTRQVELKEDRLDMVERMVKYFYTCDYDDAVTSPEPLPPEDDPTPVCSLQVNAYMYALGEKYEVRDLKKLAVSRPRSSQAHTSQVAKCTQFEKFKADCKDEDVWTSATMMRRACYTIYHHVQLPECDQDLQIIHIDQWLLGGSTLFNTDARKRLRSLMKELPDFGADLAYRFMIGNSGDITLWCLSCEALNECAREGITEGFMCSACGFDRAEEDAHVLPAIRMNMFW